MAFHTSTTYARREWAGNYNGPYHQLMDETVDLGTTIKMWEVGIQCRESRNDTGARQSLYIQILGRLTNGSWTTMSSFVTNTTDQWDRIFNWQVATGTEITAIRYIVKSQDGIARGHYGYANLWIAKWATNVAPSAPTSVTLHYNQTNDPSIPSTFPEDTSQIKIKWGAASDGDGDALKYKVERYVNGALSSTLTSGTTSLSIVDSIGSGNQGNQYSYRVTAIDPDGASAYRNSSTVTKNRLSAPTGFAANGSFGFDTSNITFNWNLATNSNGDGNISYALDAEGLPVYNHKISSGTKSKTVTVWKSGNAPTDTFIDFNELKKIVEAYQWQGDVLFKLTATNNYGSSIVVSTRVRIDLRKAPPAPTNFRIENPTTISGVGTYYISGQSNPTLKWDQVYDYLGGSITYTIQQGSYGAVATNIAYPSAGIACRLPDLNSQQTITYTITAQTSFGMTSTASFNQVIHYLKQPSLSIIIQERTSTTVNFSYTAQINSSLPLRFSVFNWQNGASGSLTNISVGDNKNPSGTATLSGLGEEASGSILFHAKDNSNLTAQTTDTKAYYAYIPILSIRKKGVGVNIINSDSSNIFVVGGNASIRGNLSTTGAISSSTISTTGKATFASAEITGTLTANQASLNSLTLNSDFKTAGRIISETPGGSSIFIQSNPDNNIPRIRYGGTGSGSEYLQIQAAGDFRVGQFSKGGFVVGNAADTTETVNSIETRNKHAGMYISSGDNFGLYDWTNGRSILQYNFANNGVTLHGKNVMYAIPGNGNYMCMAPNGSETSWVRCTTAGLIPNASGGNSSSLGTEGWRFANVYAESFRAMGLIQANSGQGTNYILLPGNGDSINYGSNNFRTRCHNGWGISDNYDNTNAVIDARNGRFIGKSAYWHNSSRCLKSDIKGIASESMPMTLSLADNESIETNLTMETIQDFLDKIDIKTYVSDFKQEGITQLNADSSEGHIKQLGYIADDMAKHPLFPYIGEHMEEFDNETGEKINDLIAINTSALTSVVIAGYQMERVRAQVLEDKVNQLVADLSAIEQVLISAGLAK